jgi:glycosyltransferase involved in cell wall biosynthesis
MTLKTLTAVIPCYNQAHLLIRQLAAYAQQDYRPLEILLIDDGSTDRTPEVMEMFAATFPHAKVLRNRPNIGVIASMNRLIDEASGDYIYFGAADDQVQPGLFSALMDCAAQYPESGLIFCDPIWERKGNPEAAGFGLSPVPTYFSPEAVTAHYRSEALSFIPGHTIIWNRQKLTDVGKFRPELGGVCDFFPIWVLAFRFGVGYVPLPLAMATVDDPDCWSSQRRRDTVAYQENYRKLIDLILSDEFSDIRRFFKESRVLCRSIWPFLPLVETGELYNMMDASDIAALAKLWTANTMAEAARKGT